MKHLEIIHSPGNARNSEGAFVELADGRILFLYSRYRGVGHEDDNIADLVGRIYTPADDSWSEDKVVVKNRALNVMSASLLRLQSGKIAMIYLEKTGAPAGPRVAEDPTSYDPEKKEWDFVDCRPWIRFSEDEAETWSDPVSLTDVPTRYICGTNDRLIQLENGRLLYPVGIGSYKAGQSIMVCYISDDEGRSWHMSQCCYPPRAVGSGLAEPVVTELKDGRILMVARTNRVCQFKAYSYDHGESWTECRPAREFKGPEAPFQMKRDPWTGDLVAIWNDYDPWHGIRPGDDSWGRTPLVMAFSSDEGKTWHGHTLLESDPDRGFCYVSMLFPTWAKGHVLLAYCWGDHGGVLDDIKVVLAELKKSNRNL